VSTYRHGSSHPTRADASRDGRLVVTAGADGRVRAFEAETGREVHAFESGFPTLRAVALSPDGERAAIDGPGDVPRIFELRTGRQLVAPAADEPGHGDRIIALAFDRDGSRLVSGSRDRTAIVWDAATLARIAVLGSAGGAQELDPGHTNWVADASFSPDGADVVTSSFDDTARIWEAATGRFRLLLAGHEDTVNCSEFSPDGRFVATASYDGSGRIWDARTGAPVVTLQGYDELVLSIAWSADGSAATTVTMHGVPRSFPLDPLGMARARRPRSLTCEELRRHEIGSAAAWAEADRLVARLEADCVLVADLVARIEAEPAVEPEVRAAALQIARERRDCPQDLARRAWWITRDPGASPQAARLALARAQASVALAPTASDFLRGLAAARLRCGDFGGALELLERSDVLATDGDPLEHLTSLSLRATVLARFGRTAEALGALERARAVGATLTDAASRTWADRFLREPGELLRPP
jgi:hypothetical protein